MKIPTLHLAFLLSLCPLATQAQVSIHIDIGLPVAPPLVVVEPGIQVVEGFPEEVFFTSGWYWCRRDDGWYRSRSPRRVFIRVEPRYVPVTLVRTPVGRYRNWHRGPGEQEARGHQGRDDDQGRPKHRKGKGKRPAPLYLPPPP